MTEFDYGELSELVLQKMYPVYVINEESKTIVFTNEIMDQMVGRPMVGENSFEAFFGDKKTNIASPEERPCGERYQWEYFEPKQNKFFKVCNVWFEHDKKRYRAGIAADVSDMMGLNRSVVDYLWLMQQLSELQIKIIREQKNTLQLIMNFLMVHYKAKKVISSHVENDELITMVCDDKGIRQTSEIYKGDGEFADIHVIDCVYKLWVENIENLEAWEEDRGFVLSIAGLYLENDLLWKRLEWENTHDKATTLFNRACFQKNATSIYNKLEQLGIIFVDIDHLKKANDEWGHEMGDSLIKKAAEVLLSVSDQRVHSYRMGGDEFMLVCRDFNPEELEKLMKEIALKSYAGNDLTRSPQISMSAGCAHSKAPFNIEELMRIADERMYEEKRKRYDFKEK